MLMLTPPACAAACRWPAASITFVENHDTGSSQRHWPFPEERLAVGYAYILTHPGLPCVFWEHYFPSDEAGEELRATIDALMQVRTGQRKAPSAQALC